MTRPKAIQGLKVTTQVKVGGIDTSPRQNHNETLVRSLRLKTGVKAGMTGTGDADLFLKGNHNETLVRG